MISSANSCGTSISKTFFIDINQKIPGCKAPPATRAIWKPHGFVCRKTFQFRNAKIPEKPRSLQTYIKVPRKSSGKFKDGINLLHPVFLPIIGVEPKNRGKTPKMDGENNGKPYEQMG